MKTIHNIATRLRHWWQRNFGYVYLTKHWAGDLFPSEHYRFAARFGKVALVWTTAFGDVPFICRLDESTHTILIDGKVYPGYGKPWAGWTWSYEAPKNGDVKRGGYWR